MPSKPEVGVGYAQEVAPGLSEDQFEVFKLNTFVSTPYISTNSALPGGPARARPQADQR